MTQAAEMLARGNALFDELPFRRPSRFIARDRLRAVLAQDRAPRGEWVRQARSMLRFVYQRGHLGLRMESRDVYRWRWL